MRAILNHASQAGTNHTHGRAHDWRLDAPHPISHLTCRPRSPSQPCTAKSHPHVVVVPAGQHARRFAHHLRHPARSATSSRCRASSPECDSGQPASSSAERQEQRLRIFLPPLRPCGRFIRRLPRPDAARRVVRPWGRRRRWRHEEAADRPFSQAAAHPLHEGIGPRRRHESGGRRGAPLDLIG